MPSDVSRALLIIVIYLVALAVVLGVTLSAYRAGKVSRWVVAGGLAVVLGVQPMVVAGAAGTDFTDSTLGLAVFMFVGTLAGAAWAPRGQQPTRL